MASIKNLPGLAVLDVASASALNFFVTLAMARVLNVSEFAAFGVFQTAQGLVLTGIQSGLTDLVLRGSPQQAAVTIRSTFALQAAASVLAVSCIPASLLGWEQARWVGLVGLGIGMSLWTANRAYLVIFRQKSWTALQVMCGALANIAVVALLLVDISTIAAWAAYIGVFAALHLVSVVSVIASLHGDTSLTKRPGDKPLWSVKMGLEGLVVGGSSQILTLIAFGRLGTTFTATFRLASVLMSPLSLLAPLFNILLVPKFSRRVGAPVQYGMYLLVVMTSVALFGACAFVISRYASGWFGSSFGAVGAMLPFVVALYVFQFGYRLLFVVSRALHIDQSIALARWTQIAVNIAIATILIARPTESVFLVGVCVAFVLGIAVLEVGLRGYNRRVS